MSTANITGALSLDATAPTETDGYDAFRSGWESQIGDDFPLPAFHPDSTSRFTVRMRVARVHDAVVMDSYSAQPIRTAGSLDVSDDQVRVFVIRRGGWSFATPRGHQQVRVPAGGFLVRYMGRPTHFDIEPGTDGTVMVLPAALLKPLIRDRQLTGPAESAEVRMLMAHADMVHATLSDLTEAGAQTARNALMELTTGLVRREVDGAEPGLADSLARAARDLADERLADSDLSPAMLARALNVSVRTLHRAFSATGESVTAYIRRRRLEQARLALTVTPGRLSVSELAAYWQFADSSHFIREFKRTYGQTPAAYARAVSPHR